MNSDLVVTSRQLQHLLTSVATLPSEVAMWPRAFGCINPETCLVDKELSAARPPLDISTKLNELLLQVEQLKSRRDFLKQLSKNNPMPWWAANSSAVELHESVAGEQFIVELQRESEGSLPASTSAH